MEVKPPVPQIPPPNLRDFRDLQEWERFHRTLPEGDKAAAVAEHFIKSDSVARSGESYHRPGHVPRLPDEWKSEAANLWRKLEEGAMQPPPRDDLEGTSDHGKTILSFWIATGRAFALGDGVILTAATLADARARVVEALRLTPSITAGGLRDLLRTTRRYAVPIAEALDREGITRRIGDERVLNQP